MAKKRKITGEKRRNLIISLSFCLFFLFLLFYSSERDLPHWLQITTVLLSALNAAYAIWCAVRLRRGRKRGEMAE